MKCLTTCSLLPLIFLLSILLPLHAKNVQRCFACTAKDSPKCAGELSPSDTELIKECPVVGTGAKWTPQGCQIFARQTDESIHPKKTFFWRDCLYLNDYAVDGSTSAPDPPVDPRAQISWLLLAEKRESPLSIKGMNERRGQLRLPLVSPYDMDTAMGPGFHAIFYHPNPTPEFWNLSNGMSIEAAAAIPRFNLTDFNLVTFDDFPRRNDRNGSDGCRWSLWILLGGGLFVIISYF